MALTAFPRRRGLGYRVTTPDFANVAFTFGPDAKAYAELFAAAPELLEALKQARIHGAFSVQHVIDAAIAKAEGRA